jgi:hypothetical protein
LHAAGSRSPIKILSGIVDTIDRLLIAEHGKLKLLISEIVHGGGSRILHRPVAASSLGESVTGDPCTQ